MARPYSVDLRARVVRAVEAGTSRRAAAGKYEVSISCVVELMQRWRRRGTVQPDRIGGWKRSTLAAHAARVRALRWFGCWNPAESKAATPDHRSRAPL